MSVKDEFHAEYIQKETPVPKLAIVAIFGLVLSLVVIVIFMSSRPDSTQEVVIGEELVIGVDDATLYVPKEAVTKAGRLTILPLTPNLYPDASDWFRSQVVSVEYLDTTGMPYPDVTFPQPVLICFKVSKKQWQHYTENPDQYQVQYYNDEDQDPVWVVLPLATYPERYQLCGQTNHLSIFALAVKPEAMIVVTGGGTPTPTVTGSLSPTPIGTVNVAFLTATSVSGGGVGGGSIPPTPVSTQAALTATSVALTATDIPPTATDVPPTNIPTSQPTATDIPPTDIPPTDIPPTDIPPTDIPPTEPPDPDPTEPPDPDPTEPPTEPTEPPTNGFSPILKFFGFGR